MASHEEHVSAFFDSMKAGSSRIEIVLPKVAELYLDMIRYDEELFTEHGPITRARNLRSFTLHQPVSPYKSWLAPRSMRTFFQNQLQPLDESALMSFTNVRELNLTGLNISATTYEKYIRVS